MSGGASVHFALCLYDQNKVYDPGLIGSNFCRPPRPALMSPLRTKESHLGGVTGTPIGSKLSDLYGQILFLRIAPFCGPDFWKNLIEEPFFEKDGEALRILRSLLSRIVIRHSKRQVLANGKSLLALPPRTIETVLLSFGNESEKEVYLRIEQQNRDYFLRLKKKSAAAVAARFVELGSLLTFARRACAHSSTVSFQAMDQFNKNVIAKEERRERRAGSIAQP